MITRSVFVFAGLALGLAMNTAQAAGDPVEGARKAKTCMGCHGVKGYRNAYPTYRVPKLGGQYQEYLVTALKEYRSGARQHPTMEIQGASLTDQDMLDIAAFFSQAQK